MPLLILYRLGGVSLISFGVLLSSDQAQPTESSLKVFNYTYSYTTVGGAAVTRTIPVKIYIPDAGTYTPGTALPVVMYLHGAGERGNGIDVDGQPGVDSWAFSDSLQLIDRPAIYVAPRGIKDFLSTDPEFLENRARWGSTAPTDYGYDSQGEFWLNDFGSTDTYDYRNVPVSASLRGALSLTDTLFTSPTFTNLIDNQAFTLPLVDTNRQYITGWSSGGDGVWDAVTRHPGKYAAALPVSGVGDPGAFFGDHVVAGLSAQPIRAFAGENDLPDQKSALAKMQTAFTNASAVGTTQQVAGANHFTVSGAVFADTEPDPDPTLLGNRNWMYAQSSPVILPEPSSMVLVLAGFLLLHRRRRA